MADPRSSPEAEAPEIPPMPAERHRRILIVDDDERSAGFCRGVLEGYGYIAVAVATVAKLPTEGLHRTFTHSVFTVAVVLAVFYLIGAISKKPRWTNLGIGLGIGVAMHILLDLVAWFNGVELFWPIRFELNFWAWFKIPEWLDKLLMTAEFLFFGLFFLLLAWLAHKQKTDADYVAKLRRWANVQFALFVLFTVLSYALASGFMMLYGAMYLLSLFLAFGVTMRMKKTIEVSA